MTPLLTQEQVVILILVCFVLVFYAAQKLLSGYMQSVLDYLTQLASPTPSQMCTFSRISAAALVLRFMSILVYVAASLALALGLFKAFEPMAHLVLPDRVLGFVLLISYCGLAAVFSGVSKDFYNSFKKLLKP